MKQAKLAIWKDCALRFLLKGVGRENIGSKTVQAAGRWSRYQSTISEPDAAQTPWRRIM